MTPLHDNMMTGIFWITRSIAQGGYPDSERLGNLLRAGVTHIINVGGAPSVVRASADGFREVLDHPVDDLRILPSAYVPVVLDDIHRAATLPNSRLYIHCVAGQNRSPTILWLYFVACGMEPNAAKSLIENRTLDAVAAHPALVNDEIQALALAHGARYRPLSRPEILEPAY